MCIVMEVLSNFSAGCTDKIAPSSSEGLGIVEMALSFDKQYFSYHEVVTEKQGICASVILLNNRISQLSLLIIMQCLLHCSALAKTERLCLLYMPEAFVPLCTFCFHCVHAKISYLSFLSIFKFVMIHPSRFKLFSQHLSRLAETWLCTMFVSVQLKVCEIKDGFSSSNASVADLQ